MAIIRQLIGKVRQADPSFIMTPASYEHKHNDLAPMSKIDPASPIIGTQTQQISDPGALLQDQSPLIFNPPSH